MLHQKWTNKQIPDLKGKVIVVTGGNSGLGYESVKAFAQKGAKVVLASRNANKGKQAKKEIGKTSGKIEVMPLDLMDFDSITAFAESFKEKYKRLDILLNNAGIMTTPYFLTKNGLEAQNGTNHFGHFALTGQLLDLLKVSPKSRVVNVSSLAHRGGTMDFDNLLFEKGKGYTPLRSYSRSKLANLLFTYELQSRFAANQIDCIAVAAHPGVSQTNLTQNLMDKWWYALVYPVIMLTSQSQAQGALPQIRAAVDSEVKGAEYYGPNGWGEVVGYPVRVRSNAAAHNKADAERLWEVSEELTGVQFQF
ncbi:MAG: oxidoreductase [Bacteroidota bacterium]